MLVQIFLLFFLLFLLFLLSRKIATYIFKIIYAITGSQKISIAVVAILVLPGTLIHEFSHFIAATIVRVPTGELTVFPSVEKGGEVKTGKLYIAETDPFRHTLIGLAPMIIGLVIIYMIGKLLLSSFSITTITYHLAPRTLLGYYVLFATSATMFSSRKDLESLVIAGPIVFLIGLSLYLVGVRIVFEESLIKKITDILSSQNCYLLIATILDYLIFVFLTLGISLLRKIFKRKIIA